MGEMGCSARARARALMSPPLPQCVNSITAAEEQPPSYASTRDATRILGEYSHSFSPLIHATNSLTPLCRRSQVKNMVLTTRKLKVKLGPPLVVQHGDICLGMVGKTGTWWPLRVHGSGHDPSVDVIFFGDSKTGRLARNKLRPFSDLEEIPSRSIPKRCAVLSGFPRMRT